MLLIDDILLTPYRGLIWVFKEIHNAALEEVEGEATRIRNELTDLYMMLETEQIDEEEFDSREGPLLDRLDELEADEGEDDGDAHDEDEDEDKNDADTNADDEDKEQDDDPEGHE